MEKLTLNANVWTPFTYSRFQVIGQRSVRITLGGGNNPANGGTYEEPAADAPYILTQSYDPKVINPLELLGIDTPSAFVYLMPDDGSTVDVVAL